MSNDPPILTADEIAVFGAYDVAAKLAEACRGLTNANTGGLNEIINTLMTELWDRGFNQTEIRTAFLSAVGDLDRYADGREQRK